MHFMKYNPFSLIPSKTFPVLLPPNPSKLLYALNSLLSELANSHQHFQALLVFSQIQSTPYLTPDQYSLSTSLKSCSLLPSPSLGSQLHSFAIRTSLTSFPHVSNSLLSFYAKTHSPEQTHKLFHSIPSPDAYSYTTLLSAYAKSGQIENALQLFEEMPKTIPGVWNAMITGFSGNGCGGLGVEFFGRMHRMGVGFDKYSFASVLNLCEGEEMVGLGRQVHCLVVRSGFLECTVSVVNALVTMYLDCGCVGDGVGVFREAKIWDTVSYSGLIAGLVSWGRDDEALMVFKEMVELVCLRPSELTYVGVLGACSSKGIGEVIYNQVIKLGFLDSTLVSNATISMYLGFGDLGNAQQVFDRISVKDVVSWNSMISCYSQENMYEITIELYRQMLRAGIVPDEFTYGSLASCTRSSKHSQMIQTIVVQNGFISYSEVCNALISAYAKCEEMNNARKMFEEMAFKNLISWNSIISAFLLNGNSMEGLESFSNLLNSGIKPNAYTLSTVLSTCGTMSTLRLGAQIHSYVLKSGFVCETSLGNSLITMYAKCGDLGSSSTVFHNMSQKDVVSWNAIIAAYSLNEDGVEAVNHFKLMKVSEVLPDNATFTIVLSACSHAGMIDEGHSIFLSMVEDYGIEPQMDQYSCIIDLLGRAGHLEEAERLINGMPFIANSHIWWTLLSSCSIHGNVRLGKIAAEFILEDEPENTAVYVLLSNIYAAEGKWREASTVREQMRNRGVMKNPGCSWIDSNVLSTV